MDAFSHRNSTAGSLPLRGGTAAQKRGPPNASSRGSIQVRGDEGGRISGETTEPEDRPGLRLQRAQRLRPREGLPANDLAASRHQLEIRVRGADPNPEVIGE